MYPYLQVSRKNTRSHLRYLRLQTNRANLGLKPRGWQVLRIKISCLVEVRTWLGCLGETVLYI